jgi:hypothetical protein
LTHTHTHTLTQIHTSMQPCVQKHAQMARRCAYINTHTYIQQNIGPVLYWGPMFAVSFCSCLCFCCIYSCWCCFCFVLWFLMRVIVVVDMLSLSLSLLFFKLPLMLMSWLSLLLENGTQAICIRVVDIKDFFQSSTLSPAQTFYGGKT